VKLSQTHLSYLKDMLRPDTYGMEIPYSIAKTLEIKGLVEWVPPKFGTTLYAITDKGREAVRTAITPRSEPT
jgi:hypothetical protein